MSRYATKPPDGQKYQRFCGMLKVLSKENPFLYRVQVKMLNAKTNRNDWRYENLGSNIPEYETPILIAYPNGKIGDGHNYKEKKDPQTREQYASFTDANSERIVGWFSPNDIRVEIIEGDEWIIGDGQIWAYYNKELVDMLTAQGGSGMEVSIETLVKDIRKDGTTEVYDSYEIIGTTILGKGVTPAVAGARIRALTDMGNELKELKLRVASQQKDNTIGAGNEPPEGQVKEGVNPRMSTNKKLMAKMQELFPDYRVMSVSEDGLTVGLYSVKDNEFSAYTFTPEAPNVVMANRFQEAKATVHVYVSKDYSYELPVEAIMDMELPEKVATLEAEKAKEAKAREDAEAALKDMQDKECTRRRNTAKDAIKAALNKWNDVHPEGERVNETVLNSINTAIDSGDYDKDEKADGNWRGDEKAVTALNAICAAESIKYHERVNGENKKVYAWSRMQNSAGTTAESDLAAVLRRNGVEA